MPQSPSVTPAAPLWQQAGSVVVVLTSVPDTLLAKRVAHVLVEERLAACVHVAAAGVSMYLWEGKLEGGEEVALTIKATPERVAALIDRLHELHPYEVPEVLVLPVAGGSAAYLQWVREQTAGV